MYGRPIFGQRLTGHCLKPNSGSNLVTLALASVAGNVIHMRLISFGVESLVYRSWLSAYLSALPLIL